MGWLDHDFLRHLVCVIANVFLLFLWFLVFVVCG